jgi:hypothetical protein
MTHLALDAFITEEAWPSAYSRTMSSFLPKCEGLYEEPGTSLSSTFTPFLGAD